MRKSAPLFGAVLWFASAACVTTGSDHEQENSCSGFQPPQAVLSVRPVHPATLLRDGIGGEATHEVVVDREGRIREMRLVGTTLEFFASPAETAIRKSIYRPATLDGQPVASRIFVVTPFARPFGLDQLPGRSRVTAFVPPSESPNARRQLASSVKKVTVLAAIRPPSTTATEIIAAAPDGTERKLAERRSSNLRQIRETVKTANFFDKPGEYRLLLRQAGQTLAEGRFAIAADEAGAILNACEPRPPS